MKHFILAALIPALLSPSVTAAQTVTTHLWSQHFGSGPGDDTGNSVAVDANGNVILTGYFSGTVNFGGSNLVSAGSWDIFVAKYSPAGTHLWSQRFGSTSEDYGSSVATDASGNVLVAGFFHGTVDFGGGALVSAGSYDIIVAKYSPAGIHLWSRRLGGTGDDFTYSIATDASDNVLMTGAFGGTTNFGGGDLVSAGSWDIVVAKYSSAGAHLWSQRFGGTSEDYGSSVATDAPGNVFVMGRFLDTVNFGGSDLSSAGAIDIVIAKYDTNGAHVWSQRLGGPGEDIGYSVAIDASGSVFAGGYFEGTANFGGGNLVSAGFNDAFLAKYDTYGAHQWSRGFGGPDYDQAKSIAVDGSGNILTTGSFRGTVNFGGGDLVSSGMYALFVATYSTSGTHLWSRSFGGNGVVIGRAVAADGSGNMTLTGQLVGAVDFGGGNLLGSIYADEDIFLAKFTSLPEDPAITYIADIGNDQGRKVKIRFDRSGHDQSESSTPVIRYEAYRRDDAPPSSSMSVHNPGGLSDRELLADGWTQVGSVDAHQETTYGIDVSTIGDSTIALGQYYTVFYIRGATATPGTFFDSAPDSGYSIDNLAPGIPGSLFYSGGQLSWNESTAEDFDYFTVYGSNVETFGSATLVDYCVASAMNVTGTGYIFYFVTATDFAGNEGTPAMVNTLSGAGGTPSSYVLSVSNFPNPFNPHTTVSYTVPSRGNVTVAIYDVRGALVATLVNNESRDAGAYRMEWNGRDDSGDAVSSGVYFARIEHNGVTRSKKMVMLK